MKYWLLITLLVVCSCGPKEDVSENLGEFQVKRDGFGFANYGDNLSVVNLTNASVSELCQIPCLRGRGDSCVISAPLESFLEFANKQMDGGHCYGMSVLSSAIFNGEVSLPSLDSTAQTTYQLPLSIPVQKLLAYYSAAQFANPSKTAALRDLTPNQVVELLRNPQGEIYGLAIFKAGSRQGHAITALSVIDDSSTSSRIAVYDSNFPGNTQRFVIVDRAANTWSYEGYKGGPEVNSLVPIPLSAALLPQTCPVKGRADTPSSATSGDWQILLVGDGDITGLPNTQSEFPVVSETQNDDSPEPIHMVPAGRDYTMNIDGSELPRLSPSAFYFHRAGYSIRIQDIFLDPSQVDAVKLGSDGNSLIYTSRDEEFVTIRVGASYEKVDYEIAIRPDGYPGGAQTEVENEIDTVAGQHSLRLAHIAAATQQAVVYLSLRRRTAIEDAEFESGTALAVGPDECVHVKYGSWTGNGQALTIVRDPGCDGNALQTTSLQDDT